MQPQELRHPSHGSDNSPFKECAARLSDDMGSFFA